MSQEIKNMRVCLLAWLFICSWAAALEVSVVAEPLPGEISPKMFAQGEAPASAEPAASTAPEESEASEVPS